MLYEGIKLPVDYALEEYEVKKQLKKSKSFFFEFFNYLQILYLSFF
jgi:hypothetical protein